MIRGLSLFIWLYEGKIIDGRNRYRACVKGGIPPAFRTWNGYGSLVEFIVSLNLHRRHLTTSQINLLAKDILPIRAAEAKERQRTAGGDHVSEIYKKALPTKTQEAVEPPQKGEAVEFAAALVGASPGRIYELKRIEKHSPALIESIRKGP